MQRYQNSLHFKFFPISVEGGGSSKINFFPKFKKVQIILGGCQENYGLFPQFGTFFFMAPLRQGKDQLQQGVILCHKTRVKMLMRHICQRLLSIIFESFPELDSARRDRDGAVGRADLNAVDEETYQGVGMCKPDIDLPYRCPCRENMEPPECKSLPLKKNTKNEGLD